jgi:hypothetical protein
VFDHADPDIIYFSRVSAGQWEIERRHTAGAGVTWTHTALSARIRPRRMSAGQTALTRREPIDISMRAPHASMVASLSRA